MRDQVLSIGTETGKFPLVLRMRLCWELYILSLTVWTIISPTNEAKTGPYLVQGLSKVSNILYWACK